ncbi:glycerate kinase [Synechococcus sp. H70.2]|uniref:glycerate kinase family protein n=1 Tax=unclassified Synechococcus TaxID=2626047 RepID=UPI0039C2A446
MLSSSGLGLVGLQASMGEKGSQFSRPPRRILVCPDSFKGSLTAKAAAESIARGIQQVLPQAEIELLPLADGGEGTLETWMLALGGEKRGLWVTGPLGDPVWAEYGVVGERALLEVAQVVGLTLVPPQRRDPTHTTTYGLGELLRAVCRDPIAEIWIGLGGSATVDAGAGMAQALGYRLLDRAGDPIGWGGGELARLARIEPPKQPVWQGKCIRGLCDVQNPLTGSWGAAAVFAPQKGATPQQVRQLEQALQHWARVVERDLGRMVDGIPGAGAAGGLGAGLVAFLGATLESGIQLLAQHLALAERIRHCDLVITGEGCLDEQSSMGKVVGAVLEQAIAAQKPLLILCGQATPAARADLTARSLPVRVGALCDRIPDVAEAQRQAGYYLAQLAAQELRALCQL